MRYWERERALSWRILVGAKISVVFMRVPQRAWTSPLPSGVLVVDIRRYEALVLNDERNSNQIRQKARTYKPGLKLVSDQICRGQTGIRVETGEADGVVMEPDQSRALVIRVIVARGTRRCGVTGHVHEAGTTLAVWCVP